MEILIFTKYDSDRITDGLKDVMRQSKSVGDTFPVTRRKMAEYVRSQIENKKEFLKCGSNEIAFIDKKGRMQVGWIRLVDVDTTRKWYVNKEGDSESICYLDNYVCSDIENNYYEDKNKI